MPTVDLSERDSKDTLLVKEEVTNDAEIYEEVFPFPPSEINFLRKAGGDVSFPLCKIHSRKADCGQVKSS